MKVTTVEQMRAMDRAAIEEFGVPEQILMENAGIAAATVIERTVGAAGGRFVVVCGLGNNGGDGLVVARKLHSNGAQVEVLILGAPERFGATSKRNYDMAISAGIEVIAQASPLQISSAIDGCTAVIDGLLGTGLTGEVDSRYREAIEAINAAGVTVFSLDIPSGVDGDAGLIHGIAIAADATITFGLPKLGNVLYPGASLGGQLHATHISFPPQLIEREELVVEITDPLPLPFRRADGHKGTFGDVLCIAGAANYFGAPSLAALSVLKAGGGYSRLAAPKSIVPHVAGLASEVVFIPQDETDEGSLAGSTESRLLDLSGIVDFVILGPGLSLVDETQQLVRDLTPRIERPLLIDGDGLTAISHDLDVVRRRTAPTVLTPHFGEMATLMGRTVAELREDPVGAVRSLSSDLGAVVVLKGARTMIGVPGGLVTINTSGNSGMGTAGSGDVLTGSIAAMVGSGLDIDEAARTGVFLHGVAGDLAAEFRGEDGLTARDVLEHLPLAVRVFREDHAELTRDYYGVVEVV